MVELCIICQLPHISESQPCIACEMYALGATRVADHYASMQALMGEMIQSSQGSEGAGGVQITPKQVRSLLKLTHSDRWVGTDLEDLAGAITQWLLENRE